MHPGKSFAWDDRGEMLEFVSERAFAHIFVGGADARAVLHAPILVVDEATVQFHAFRNNRAAPLLPSAKVLASITALDAYQSANWYVSDNQVPTWHYQAVEIEGTARALGESELIEHLDRLSAVMEGRFSPDAPWTRAKMEPGKFEAMIKALAGFEVAVEAIRGTRKFNQHKPADDIAANVRGLTEAGTERRRRSGLAPLARPMNRLAVFDCDGTLVDSGATIHAALRETFVQHALDVPPPSVSRRVIGLSLIEAMAMLVPDGPAEQHEQLAEDYKRAFQRLRAAGKVEEPLFDGVLQLLDTLERDGWLLAVATGKSDRGLKHCLEEHGLHARFVSLQTADRHPSKPHPSMVEQAIADAGAAPETTIVVGDTSFDMAMAVAAGAAGIGAGWGYHDAQELIDAGAVAVAEAPLDVLALVRSHADG